MSPLPDADKKSPRVYTLTQNTDLENLAFATMQSIGQPISIEEMSEDELRRLVLVCAMPPYGSAKVKSNGKTDQKGMFFPFISPQSGALASMRMRINTAVAGGGFFVGIYSADENTFMPKDLIGYAEFATDSTGNLEVTSFSSTITLTRGTYYWMYSNADSATTATNCVFYANEMATGTAVPSLGGPYDTISTQPVGVGLRYSSNNTGTPESSITASDLEGSFPFGATQTGDPPTILLAWT